MPLKIYAIVAGLIVLAGLVGGLVHLSKKAQRVDVAEAALADYRAQVAARDKQAAKDRADDEARRMALSQTLATTENELAQLRANPITRVVTREKIVNGVSCPDPRLGPDVARLWNSHADVATRAVSGTN